MQQDKKLFRYQLAWIIMLITMTLPIIYNNKSLYGYAFVALIVLHGISVFAFHRGKNLAWYLCMFVPCLSFCLYGPMVFYNFYLMIIGHPLYIDSPGTGIVVGIYALFFVFPPVIIVALLLKIRRM